ncbi:MAG: hypothetical protein JXQ96_13185 [Cyclobacteriaceae bacterium]
MEINQFNKVGLGENQFIKVHFIDGKTLGGSYLGNLDTSTMEFDVSNHATGTTDRLCLDDIDKIEKLL